MKIKNLLTVAAAFALVACTSNQTAFSVTVKGTDGEQVNVVDRLTGDVIATASATGFEETTVNGKADKDALLGVVVDGDSWTTLFFNDGTPLLVDKSTHFVSGSDLNQQVTATDLRFTSLFESIIEDLTSMEGLPEDEFILKQAEINNKIESYGNGYKLLLQENGDNLLPVAFMGDIIEVLEGDEEVEALITDPANAYANHPYTKGILEKHAEEEAIMAEREAEAEKIIGQQFIDLQEPDVNGNIHSLSEYVGKGKWVLIDFWASWCSPCRGEMPNVTANYKKYHDKGFEIVGLSFDNEKEPWVEAIKELDMPWIHLSDLKGWKSLAAETYGIHAIPSSLLVDPDGKIVARNLRGEALGNKLAEIFGE